MMRLLNSLANSVGDTWCQLMHPDPMWPVRGEYQCRVCQRRFPVAWEKPNNETALPKNAAIAAKHDSIAPVTVSQIY